MQRACGRRERGSKSVRLEYRARGRVVQNKLGEIDGGHAMKWGHGKTVWGLVGHGRAIHLYPTRAGNHWKI